MRNLIVAVASLLLASSAALAAPPKAPVGNGNFRRADAIKAAGAKPTYTTRVVGAATANGRVTGLNLPKGSRVLMVEHKLANGERKVDLVKAPLDKGAPVERLSAKSAHKMGLVTQAEARRMAEHNGGEMGSKGKVTVKADGIGARRGSYSFTQVKPAAVEAKMWGGKYRIENISRTVPVSGNPGESASPGKETPIK
jgi:hypothetical protein